MLTHTFLMYRLLSLEVKYTLKLIESVLNQNLKYTIKLVILFHIFWDSDI